MSKGVGKLHFWGQRERPMTPRELAARVPIIGKGRSKEDREFNHQLYTSQHPARLSR